MGSARFMFFVLLVGRVFFLPYHVTQSLLCNIAINVAKRALKKAKVILSSLRDKNMLGQALDFTGISTSMLHNKDCVA
jgi:hypothetical protein